MSKLGGEMGIKIMMKEAVAVLLNTSQSAIRSARPDDI